MQKSQNQNPLTVHIFGLIAWFIFFALVIKYPTFASITTSSQAQQNTVESYGTNQALRPGILVQIDPSNVADVIPASQPDIKKTLGVVISPSASTITVDNSTTAADTAYVSSNGNYQMVVSDQNGSIKAGDYLTLSAVDGIAMEDNSIEPVTVGIASSSFNGSSGVIGTGKVELSNKTYKTVHYGIVTANVSISHNPLLAVESSIVPSFLVNFSTGIVGKTVSPWRIYVALVITLAVCIIVGAMLYGAVRSSLTSIGRNPLSRSSLFRGFLQVVVSAVIIFISGIFLVYLLLKV